ncbi:Phage tail protein [Paraburkholderia tropica]
MPRDEMLRSMTSEEFTRWMEFEKIEPFGERLADLRMGTLAALLANLHRDTKRKREPYVPSDFAPWMLDAAPTGDNAPILLKDGKAQSNMIRSSLFGKRLRRSSGK